MSRKTKQEWLEKAHWEGGLFEGLAYGLTHEDLDPAEDPDFYDRVKGIVEAFSGVKNAVESVGQEIESVHDH